MGVDGLLVGLEPDHQVAKLHAAYQRIFGIVKYYR